MVAAAVVLSVGLGLQSSLGVSGCRWVSCCCLCLGFLGVCSRGGVLKISVRWWCFLLVEVLFWLCDPNNRPVSSEMSEAKKNTHQSSYYNRCPLPNQEAEAGVDLASVPLPSCTTKVPNSPTPYHIGIHITTRSKVREARRKTQSTNY